MGELSGGILINRHARGADVEAYGRKFNITLSGPVNGKEAAYLFLSADEWNRYDIFCFASRRYARRETAIMSCVRWLKYKFPDWRY